MAKSATAIFTGTTRMLRHLFQYRSTLEQDARPLRRAGWEHTCAILDDGSLKCGGAINYELGYATEDTHHGPQSVSTPAFQTRPWCAPLPQQLTSVRQNGCRGHCGIPLPASFSTTATSSVGAPMLGALSLWALGI